MEQTVNVNGKMYIIPAGKVSSLVAWLEANAVDAGKPRQEVREVIDNQPNDGRQLIME